MHRLRMALAVLTVAAMLPATPAAAAGTTTIDSTYTAAFHARTDAARAAAHQDKLYVRTAYTAAAQAAVVAVTHDQTPRLPSDDAPMSYIGWVEPYATLDTAVSLAIDAVLAAQQATVKYPLHTDAGWAVGVRDVGGGQAYLAAALVVGWPAPAVPASSGCAVNGYCWSQSGLNPHLPWTRNRVVVSLSTSHLPAAGATLLKAAIGRINAVHGLGADLVYGGTTTATGPTALHRFVVVWGSGCLSAAALACTTNGYQGTYRLVYQSRVLVSAAKYAAAPAAEPWVGTLAHELGHLLGLGHFDASYVGHYQLMRWAGGPNTVQAGDANGLRRLAPPGQLTASLSMPAGPVRSGQRLAVVVHGKNAGLGGQRAARLQCTAANGTYRTVTQATFVADGRSKDTALSWVVPSGPAYAARCRAVVASKAATVAGPWRPVTLGG